MSAWLLADRRSSDSLPRLVVATGERSDTRPLLVPVTTISCVAASLAAGAADAAPPAFCASTDVGTRASSETPASFATDTDFIIPLLTLIAR